MESSQTQAKEAVPAERTLPAMQAQMKAVYETFTKELSALMRKHRENLGVILKDIDERKMKDLKEKLKNL